MTRDELRAAIEYHQRVHRPYLFAPAAGPIRDCQLPTCHLVLVRLGLREYGTGWARGSGRVHCRVVKRTAVITDEVILEEPEESEEP